MLVKDTTIGLVEFDAQVEREYWADRAANDTGLQYDLPENSLENSDGGEDSEDLPF